MANWLQGKGLNKLCAVFEGVEVIIFPILDSAFEYMSVLSCDCIGNSMICGDILWRSISAKIQCSILRCTLHNLSYILCLPFEVCTRDSTFLHSTSNFDSCNIQVYAFDIQLFISNSQVFEFDLQVQWNVHSFFASNIKHLSFKFSLPTSDFGHCTCKFPHSTFKFWNWTFTRWSATDRDRGLN